MGAAEQLYAKYLRRETEFTELVKALRSFYHSLNADERGEVVDILGSISEPDATRELLQLYVECQWRTTRFQIIRALSKNPTPRSLEFLMSIAKDPTDVPLCEAALWALGQSRSPQAGRFLVHLFAGCRESIRPYVVGALGRIPDNTLQAELVELLAKAIDSNESLLTRHLVSTLSELRSAAARPLIHSLLARPGNPTLARTALLSLGKLSRDVGDLKAYEKHFQGDVFTSDLFASVQAQIMMRSRFSVEECIEKALTSDDMLPVFALELNLFPEQEVLDALTARAADGSVKRLCRILASLNFVDVPNWYSTLFPFRTLTRERVFHILESIQSHESESFLPLLEASRAKSLRDIRSPLFERWFQAASLSLPHAERVFTPYLESDAWTELPTDQKITVINHFVNFALCVQSDETHFEAVCDVLKKTLLKEELPQVRARLLRAFGQLERFDEDVFAFVRNRIHDIRLASSALFYVEKSQPPGGLDLCLEIIAEGSHKNQLAQGLLRAMAEQKGNIGQNTALDQFLKRCLTRECPPETQLLALNFLVRHPRRDLLTAIVSFRRAEERLQLAAIVALRNFADDMAVDALQECLGSSSESVVGRALDSLTCAPGPRAKMIVLEFLERNIHDLEVCDKVIRCLGPLHGLGVGLNLSGRVERLIHANPHHPMIDGLFLLKERLNPRSALSLVAAGRGVEIEEVDAKLEAALPCYADFDEELRSVLRAAELPFTRPDLFGGAIDKSAVVVQLCKAIDMRIGATWGKDALFPSLERSLHVFQNIVHGAGLAEEPPSPERTLRFFELAPRFQPTDLPLAKMSALARGILQGRVIGDHWRIFDGLRAWAVALMLFGRPSEGMFASLSQEQRAGLPLVKSSSDDVLDLVSRLLRLQETRSLAVHRHTFSSVSDLEGIRREAFDLLARLQVLV
jgi:HEAT repeat protein